ncbi:MAG: S1 RNA-binding domain-containing protein [Oscillospiraceae bacterium]|nr:S1 RNA-binding domain-containing protein [Oscillospiraceae bacterium]
MEFTVGAIVEGKVTGITKFGAFVSLPGNKTGMVHISEIAHAYVSDINEHLTVGQDVKVMIISMEGNKINLSIKKTMDPPARQNRSDRGQTRGEGRENRNDRESREGRNDRGDRGDRPQRSSGNRGGFDSRRQSQPKEPQSFDDMLKQFMADSDSKISSIKQYSDHRTKRGRRQ